MKTIDEIEQLGDSELFEGIDLSNSSTDQIPEVSRVDTEALRREIDKIPPYPDNRPDPKALEAGTLVTRIEGKLAELKARVRSVVQNLADRDRRRVNDDLPRTEKELEAEKEALDALENKIEDIKQKCHSALERSGMILSPLTAEEFKKKIGEGLLYQESDIPLEPASSEVVLVSAPPADPKPLPIRSEFKSQKWLEFLLTAICGVILSLGIGTLIHLIRIDRLMRGQIDIPMILTFLAGVSVVWLQGKAIAYVTKICFARDDDSASAKAFLIAVASIVVIIWVAEMAFEALGLYAIEQARAAIQLVQSTPIPFIAFLLFSILFSTPFYVYKALATYYECMTERARGKAVAEQAELAKMNEKAIAKNKARMVLKIDEFIKNNRWARILFGYLLEYEEGRAKVEAQKTKVSDLGKAVKELREPCKVDSATIAEIKSTKDEINSLFEEVELALAAIM